MAHTRNRRVPRPRPPADPLTSIIETVSRRARQEFRGQGVRVGVSTVVHEVAETPWFGGVTYPAPACRAGFSVSIARLHPVDGEITCKRCRRANSPVNPTGIHQETLFEVGDLTPAA